MALCLRRLLRKYSSISYPSLSSQYAFRDQRNTPSFIVRATEVNHNCWALKMTDLYRTYQSSGNTGGGKSAESNEKDAWKNDLTLLGNGLYCDNLYLSSLFEKEVFQCAEKCEAFKENETQQDIGSPFDKPSIGQLQRIHDKLSGDLPYIFIKSIDYTIYHPNLIFENNIRGTRSVGIVNYIKQIQLFKLYVAIKYASVRLEILKITSHIEDGTVRIRWRIRGISGFKIFILFWKKKLWKQKFWKCPRQIIEEEDGWVDGFSIFYVKGDGLVHKHVASKMMPDNSGSILQVKNPLAAKVALIVGLVSRDFTASSFADIDEFIDKESPPS